MALFLLFLVFNGFLSILASGSNTMRFELIHRHSAKEFSSPKTQQERVNDLLQGDKHRVQIISQRLGGKRRRDLETATIPMNSGAYSSTGQYFVHFQVGTPSQKFLLVTDTGSDLTWMNCRYHCNNCGGRIQRRRVFNTARSSSFQPIPCSTPMCSSLSLAVGNCSTPTVPCQYEYSYLDGSKANGIYANETVKVRLANGRKMQLEDVLIGCSSLIEGSSFAKADGVLGLGYSENSFVMKARKEFGGTFSYCLVDHLSPRNVSSYLTFGHDDMNTFVGSGKMQYTELVPNLTTNFYPLNLAGISIGGVMLNIPMEVWDMERGGGVIIDSGTTLTSLAAPAYNAVMDALKTPLMKFTTEIQLEPFDFCFNGTGFDESLVPKLVIHFADSAQFQPPAKSYVMDTAPGVKCLAFATLGWPDVSIIGNILQQNFLWEFDTVNKWLGFAPSSCTTD